MFRRNRRKDCRRKLILPFLTEDVVSKIISMRSLLIHDRLCHGLGIDLVDIDMMTEADLRTFVLQVLSMRNAFNEVLGSAGVPHPYFWDKPVVRSIVEMTLGQIDRAVRVLEDITGSVDSGEVSAYEEEQRKDADRISRETEGGFDPNVLLNANQYEHLCKEIDAKYTPEGKGLSFVPYRKLTRDLFVGMLATRISHIRMLKNERIDGTADDFMSDMDYYEMIEEVESDLKQYPSDAVAEARELEAKLNDA